MKLNRKSKIEKPVAFVTGGTSYIGRSICKLLVSAGYDLILQFNNSAKDAKSMSKDCKAIGARIFLVKADLRILNKIPRMVKKVLRVAGRLDLLVNNASIFRPTESVEKSLKNWLETFAVNIHAPYLLSLCAAPWLRKTNGSIVNIGDIYGENATLKNYPCYCATKASIHNLSRGLAKEWGPKIRVNVVAPGAIKIPKKITKEMKRNLLQKIYLRHEGIPDDVGKAVCFLAENKYINGEILRVDGGRDC